MHGATIPAMKKAAGGKLLCATAGGIRVEVVKGRPQGRSRTFSLSVRGITASKDIEHAANEFIEQLNREEIDQFRIMTDF